MSQNQYTCSLAEIQHKWPFELAQWAFGEWVNSYIEVLWPYSIYDFLLDFNCCWPNSIISQLYCYKLTTSVQYALVEKILIHISWYYGIIDMNVNVKWRWHKNYRHKWHDINEDLMGTLSQFMSTLPERAHSSSLIRLFYKPLKEQLRPAAGSSRAQYRKGPTWPYTSSSNLEMDILTQRKRNGIPSITTSQSGGL